MSEVNNILYDEVSDIIAQKVKKDKDSVLNAESFEKLQMDSLDVVEVVMALEEKYSIEIPNEKMSELNNVAKLADFIENNRKKN